MKRSLSSVSAMKVNKKLGTESRLYMYALISGVGMVGLLLAVTGIADSIRQNSVSPPTGRLHSTGKGIRETRREDLDLYKCSGLGFPGRTIASDAQYQDLATVRKFNQHRLPGCRSKFQQHCFWKRGNKPSPAFLSALRNYEHLHRRCVQGYNLTEHLLDGTVPSSKTTPCKYLVWKMLDGKGNQLMSLVSAFAYALITKRVLLITPEAGMQQLFCEPFTGSSWLVPPGFPETYVRERSDHHGVFYERASNMTRAAPMLGNNSLSTMDEQLDRIPRPPHLVAYLTNWSRRQDLRFFCTTEQKLLTTIPWLFFWSNQYSIPGLYFLPSFRQELNRLFPDKAVFLHAARYLLNPKDAVWGRIIRFYKSYLAAADRKLGIQVRTWSKEYHPVISMHVLACATETGLLPNLTNNPAIFGDNDDTGDISGRPGSKEEPYLDEAAQAIIKEAGGSQKLSSRRVPVPPNLEKVVVLLTSLRREYHENLTEFYVKYATRESGHPYSIMVVSPSAEEEQQTGVLDHDQKVIADMWLLSFMDDVISTPRSTLGYVAHGLAGITPVVFRDYGLDRAKVPPGPSCHLTNLPGPCFIDHPEQMPCPLEPDPVAMGVGNVDNSVPEVRHCLLQWGIGVYEGT